MSVEKRKFPRANVVCKISTIFAERVLVFNAHTENIGEGGIRVILDEKLHVPTDVALELFLEGRNCPIVCKGEITWVKNINPIEIGPPLYDTGISFQDIAIDDRKVIQDLVTGILARDKSGPQ